MSVKLGHRTGLRQGQSRASVRGNPLHHPDLGSYVPMDLGEGRNVN
jgi:hypothetical protein